MGFPQFNVPLLYVQQSQIAAGAGVLPSIIASFPVARVQIDAILVANEDGIPHVVKLNMNGPAVATTLGSTSLASGEGVTGAPSVDLIANALAPTVTALILDPTVDLTLTLAVAMAGAALLHVTVLGHPV